MSGRLPVHPSTARLGLAGNSGIGPHGVLTTFVNAELRGPDTRRCHLYLPDQIGSRAGSAETTQLPAAALALPPPEREPRWAVRVPAAGVGHPGVLGAVVVHDGTVDRDSDNSAPAPFVGWDVGTMAHSVRDQGHQQTPGWKSRKLKRMEREGWRVVGTTEGRHRGLDAG